MNINKIFHFCKTSLSFLRRRGFLFLLVFLFFASCSTLPLSGSEFEKPSSFQTLETIEPVWHSFADGIKIFQGKIAEPVLEFWALQIDLGSPDIRIAVNGDPVSTRVSSFVRDNNLIAGINAVPFDVITAREGQPIKNIGIVISDGELISPANRTYDALVIYRNRRAAIVRQSSINSIENIENAIGGFYQILAAEQPTERITSLADRHPRSAAGVSADGRFVYFLVVDGRRAGSIGSTQLETALILRSLGCRDGVNFDGGGSSALALRYQDGTVRTLNTPIHSGIPGRERAVAGCIGVYSIFPGENEVSK